MAIAAALTRKASTGMLNGKLDAHFSMVAADLAFAEEVFAAELHSRLPHVQELVRHLEGYRGKRLRPMLVLLTAQACGQVTREHHVLAAVVEMIHTATLVHDDVLDDAAIRRHVPTVNARFGNQRSVLLGDLLFTHAFYLASTTGSTLACKIIGETTNRVCEGELHQIAEQGNLDLSEAAYRDIIAGKTAALTACCCQLGALFSGTTEDIVEQLTTFGHHLGMAFQIADDVLDLVGDERETGKSLGSDLSQRKLTLPLIHFLAHGEPNAAQDVRRRLEQGLPVNCVSLREQLRTSGSLRYAVDAAQHHADLARQALQVLNPSPARDLLEALAVESVHRRA